MVAAEATRPDDDGGWDVVVEQFVQFVGTVPPGSSEDDDGFGRECRG